MKSGLVIFLGLVSCVSLIQAHGSVDILINNVINGKGGSCGDTGSSGGTGSSGSTGQKPCYLTFNYEDLSISPLTCNGYTLTYSFDLTNIQTPDLGPFPKLSVNNVDEFPFSGFPNCTKTVPILPMYNKQQFLTNCMLDKKKNVMNSFLITAYKEGITNDSPLNFQMASTDHCILNVDYHELKLTYKCVDSNAPLFDFNGYVYKSDLSLTTPEFRKNLQKCQDKIPFSYLSIFQFPVISCFLGDSFYIVQYIAFPKVSAPQYISSRVFNKSEIHKDFAAKHEIAGKIGGKKVVCSFIPNYETLVMEPTGDCSGLSISTVIYYWADPGFEPCKSKVTVAFNGEYSNTQIVCNAQGNAYLLIATLLPTSPDKIAKVSNSNKACYVDIDYHPMVNKKTKCGYSHIFVTVYEIDAYSTQYSLIRNAAICPDKGYYAANSDYSVNSFTCFKNSKYYTVNLANLATTYY